MGGRKFENIRGLFRLAAVAAAVGAANCTDPAGPYVAADSVGRVRVALGSSPTQWRTDAMQIDSARAEADTLVVHVTHGGGCAAHEYAAIAWNGWLESHPVQVGTLIAHDGHDDPCDALISARLRFDLTPLKQAYWASYGTGSAVLILRLATSGSTGNDSVLVPYPF
jgi:hypothetical protein